MTHSPLIISYGCRARVGKDFACNVSLDLCKALNILATRRAFADVLKRELEEDIHYEFGISVWTDRPDEKEIIRPRLVSHGMQMRKQDPNHWIKTLWQNYQRDEIEETSYGRKPNKVLIIPDVRFRNEVEFVHANGGVFINILLADHVNRDKYINDEERENAPKCDPLADRTIENDLDTQFGQRVACLVACLVAHLNGLGTRQPKARDLYPNAVRATYMNPQDA